MDFLNLAQRLVERGQMLGAYMTEVYVLDARALTVEVANRAVETLKLAEENGVGIRIITRDGQMGFAFSSDLRETALEQTVRQALVNAAKTYADIYNTLPQTVGDIPNLKTFDPKIAAASIDEKIALARQAEEAAYSYDRRVTKTERAVYQDVQQDVSVANSRGLAVAYRAGYCGLYAVMLAEADGDVETGTALAYYRDYDRLDPVKLGEEAAAEAVALLGAKTVETQRTTLVLSPYIATEFLGVIAPALTADAVQKGRSLFKGRIGENVAADKFSLIDDGRLDGGVATAPVDSEGVPAARTVLIRDGVLQGFLHNTYTAAKDRVASTGNGVRSSFKTTPEVGPTNLFIAPGNVSRDHLIGEVDHGFYVTNVMGMHTANPISGDFSVGAAGIWVKNGKLTTAVRGVAIAGNILDLLSGIDCIADDLRFFGATGAPTIRVVNVSVSGM